MRQRAAEIEAQARRDFSAVTCLVDLGFRGESYIKRCSGGTFKLQPCFASQLLLVQAALEEGGASMHGG